MKYLSTLLILIIPVICMSHSLSAQVISWTGNTDSNWHNTENWNPAVIPMPSSDVVINASTNQPIISQTAVAMSILIEANASLTNQETLTVSGASSGGPTFGIGIRNFGTFTNQATGSIHIQNTDDEGIRDDRNAIIDNYGEINIGIGGSMNNIGGYGMCIRGNLVNRPNASIQIQNTTIHGLLSSFGDGIIDNYGQVSIGVGGVSNNIESDGIRITGSLTNQASGSIHIQNTGFDGISTSIGALINNYGQISIGLDGPVDDIGAYGIFASPSIINNYSCATIDLNDNFYNRGSIINQGSFSLNSSNPSTITSSGSFSNQGLLHDPQGSIDLNDPGFSNADLVISSTSGCNQSPISSAFILGSNPDLTIEGIYVDDQLTSSGGTYNQVSNTFTPSPQVSTGEYVYYVHVQDINNGGCADTLRWVVSTVACCPSNPIYVNKSATIGNNDGTSWATAYVHLQDALASTCGTQQTEIWVATNQYYPDEGLGVTPSDRDTSFVMQNKLSILGGFPASGSPTINDRDWILYPTFLVGDVDGDITINGNSYHVVSNDQNGLDATAVMDGFTIIGGKADPGGFNNFGAGVFNRDSSPRFVNCRISQNEAVADGGGVYNLNSQAQFENVEIISNKARDGAGMYSDQSAIDIYKCLFNTNTASRDGGALRFTQEANAVSTVRNTRFRDNRAMQRGGAIAINFNDASLTNCLFLDNEASIDAGAILNDNFSQTDIINCSFFANVAPTAATIITEYNASTTIHNSILWGGIGTQEMVNTANTSVDYSIVQGGWPGTGNLDEDPLYSNLNNGDLIIDSGCSPAINAGLNAHNSEPLALIGPRLFETIDMGAYEFFGDSRDTITYTGSSSTDVTDWHLPQNWDHFTIPERCHDVVIPSPFDVLIYGGNEGIGKTLDVQLGAALETQASGLMDIRNN